MLKTPSEDEKEGFWKGNQVLPEKNTKEGMAHY